MYYTINVARSCVYSSSFYASLPSPSAASWGFLEEYLGFRCALSFKYNIVFHLEYFEEQPGV